jgi:hypothetical protein
MLWISFLKNKIFKKCPSRISFVIVWINLYLFSGNRKRNEDDDLEDDDDDDDDLYHDEDNVIFK